MTLVDYALASLADVKLFLGIASGDTSKDELVKLYINIATDEIESYTGRRFEATDYTDVTFNGNGEKEILLPQYPIISITTLAKNGAYNNTSDWEDLGTEDYWWNEFGIVSGVCKFSEGVENYKATYRAGYETIPYDLQFACMQLVKNLLDGYTTGSDRQLERETLGDHTVVFAKTAESMMNFQKTMDKYKKPNY